jgi:protein TonB
VITQPAKPRFTESPAVNPRQRALMIAAMALLYAGLIAALVRGLGGGVVADAGVTDPALVALTLPAETPPPSPASKEPAGAQAEIGKKAKPKAIVAARPRIPNKAAAAAPAASTGADTRSGVGESGSGTGGGGAGAGTGSGGSGNGSGAGALRAVKIAGEITAVRDYPAKDRAARQGKQVIVVLRVGSDGLPKSCRVHKPSGVDAADATTCALALKRFRFRPALDRSGTAIESDYGWEQHWNAP